MGEAFIFERGPVVGFMLTVRRPPRSDLWEVWRHKPGTPPVAGKKEAMGSLRFCDGYVAGRRRAGLWDEAGPMREPFLADADG